MAWRMGFNDGQKWNDDRLVERVSDGTAHVVERKMLRNCAALPPLLLLHQQEDEHGLRVTGVIVYRILRKILPARLCTALCFLCSTHQRQPVIHGRKQPSHCSRHDKQNYLKMATWIGTCSRYLNTSHLQEHVLIQSTTQFEQVHHSCRIRATTICTRNAGKTLSDSAVKHPRARITTTKHSETKPAVHIANFAFSELDRENAIVKRA